MQKLTLESLARRLEEVERRLNEKEAGCANDWRMAAGMFTRREFSRIVDEEGRKISGSGSGRGTPGVRRVILRDTDHLTVLKYTDSEPYARLHGRLLAAAPARSDRSPLLALCDGGGQVDRRA
jgi:hypothetical protein